LRHSSGELGDLITERGCVLTRIPPLFEILADTLTFDALGTSPRRVLLTEKLDDAVLLRSLGRAAAPVAGLSDLGQKELELLARYFGVERELSERELEEADKREESDHGKESAVEPGDPSKPGGHPRGEGDLPDDISIEESDTCYLVPCSDVGTERRDPLELTLVQWSPSALTTAQPEAMKNAVRYLQELAEYRGVDVSVVMEWVPTDRDIAAIRFGLQRGESGWAKDALLDSLHQQVRAINAATRKASNTAQLDLAAEYQRLDTALFSHQADARWPERRKEIVQRYLETAGRLVTLPMIRQAQAAGDSLQQSLWIQLAQLHSMFESRAVWARVQLLSPSPWGSKASNHSQSVSEMLDLSSRIVALIKELSKC
jgi:hypothetical protein